MKYAQLFSCFGVRRKAITCERVTALKPVARDGTAAARLRQEESQGEQEGNLSKLSSYFVLWLCLAIVAAPAQAQSSHDPEPAGSTPKPAPPSLPPLAARPVIALTFDDLPAAADLPPGDTRTAVLTRLAAELKANHLKGTYGFVNAVKLENDPDAQQALHVWVDAGMNIGSHTWSHMSLTANSAEAFERNIAQNEPALVQYAHGRDWHWFRYPFLWEGDTVEKRRAVRTYLREHGYRIAQVSLDFEDYGWNDAYARCSAKNGSASIDWLKQSYLDTAVEYIRLGR